MNARLLPSIKAGIVGAAMLFIVVLTFGYYWFMMRSETGLIGGIYGPGYLLSFIMSGVLATSLAHKDIDSADRALSSGVISGCVTAVILVITWIIFSVDILLWLDYKTWIGISLSVAILIMVGIVISAFSSVAYAYIGRNFGVKKP